MYCTYNNLLIIYNNHAGLYCLHDFISYPGSQLAIVIAIAIASYSDQLFKAVQIKLFMQLYGCNINCYSGLHDEGIAKHVCFIHAPETQHCLNQLAIATDVGYDASTVCDPACYNGSHDPACYNGSHAGLVCVWLPSSQPTPHTVTVQL